MNDYWERQRAKKAQNQPQRQTVTGSSYYQPAVGPQSSYPENRPFHGQSDPLPENHDFSQADHLRQGKNECPNCPPDPKTGIRGNMFRATQNSVMRCFNCSYIDGGRDIHDPSSRQTRGAGTGAEGPVQRAKQTIAGGSTGHNYHGFSSEGRPVEGIDR